MSKKVLKVLYITAALAAGAVFVTAAVMDTVLLLDYSRREVDGGTALIILVLSFAVMLASMTAIVFANRQTDADMLKVITKKKPARWAMNTLFVSLIFVLIVMAGYGTVTDSSILRAGAVRNSGLITVLAVTAAIVIYVLNYHRMQPRGRQIRRIVKRSSLNGRRFVFLREEVTQDGLWKGKLSGELHTGDRVCIIESSGSRHMAKVRRIYRDGRKTRLAADCVILLELNLGSSETGNGYTVVSGQIPVSTVKGFVAAENPRISGMLTGVSERYEDSDFMSSLIYDFVHGSYLVPAKVGEKDTQSGDITEAIKGSHDVMFMSVTSSRDPDKAVLPVFTDWDALCRYQNVMEDEKSVVLLMSFQQTVEIMHKGYDGFVINPFGPASFFLSEGYVHSITSLEGYREEFINSTEN